MRRLDQHPRTLLALVVGCLWAAAAPSRAQTVPPVPRGGAPAARTTIGPIPGPGPRGVSGPTNPFSGDRVAIAEGRRLFLWYNCYGCHGGRAGGGMGPSLRDTTWLYGSDDGHVFASIAEGRGKGMPAWGTKLPEDQIWKIVAYIHSLRTPLEPQAPTAYETKRE